MHLNGNPIEAITLRVQIPFLTLQQPKKIMKKLPGIKTIISKKEDIEAINKDPKLN